MASDAVKAGASSRESLELLYHISRELASALELRTVLERVLKLSLENVKGISGSLIVLDNKGRALDSIIVYKNRVIEETNLQLKFTLDQGLAGWVVSNREAALVRDTSQDERWQSTPRTGEKTDPPKSTVSAPLLVRDELVGVITLTHPEPGFFDEDTLALVQAIADQAAFAVLNARLYAESLRRTQVLSALVESAASISASLQLDEVLKRILKQTTKAMEVEAVSLALVEPDGKNLAFRAATGGSGNSVEGLMIKMGQGIAGWVAKEGEGVIVQDVQDDPRFYADVDAATGYETRSIACAPIRAKGSVIGVLEALNPVSGGFASDALLVLEGIGNLAGTAIQHAQLFQQVEVARKRYLELFEDSVDPILITDRDGKIQEANRQAEILLGFDKDTLHQMNVHHFHQADWKTLGKDLAHLGPDKTVSYESVLHSGGHETHVEMYVRWVEVDRQQVLQWIMRDITERRNLDTLRDDLASMIYHDLRSPLANVVSGLDVLEMMLPADEDPTIRSVLDIAMRSTERVQRLATSLLDTSRMEAGQPIGNPEPTSATDMVQAALEAALTAAEAREVKLEGSVAKNLPKVLADAEMIRRVMINLLENAIKYSKEGQTVTLGAKRAGEEIEFWVQDQGRGIPKAEQERIFEKFARVQTGASGNTKGLGLGLAYCKLAVEGHGGRIWVESQPGEGAKFIFTLQIA